ncbi:putative N-formylglutamate aminohydrolase [Anaerovibrio sp. JC8]|uniref:N-formylglutamate amidohydrolase n=1 Tax=Anaerovibrio sp. JC8 TaxID=1240085 RepID=UPI000A09EC13|nr:N-formylglutamate amidohydrolase [Anaerovibrio sp. JC8]ORU00272.1 putative N-formylglutamate aminohydrolase [Anaerovibrio sp. JC8]
MMEKVVIHVPHASLYIPEEYIPDYDLEVLSHEMLVMTDWYCNELFACEAEMVDLKVSRLVCDVERFRDDKDETMSQRGMGLYYTHSSWNMPFRKFSNAKREEVIRNYYDPHHAELEAAVEQRLAQYGHCLIIDGHSFYPKPLPYELDQQPDRPDICIGTDDYHTPPELVEKMVNYLRAHNLSVGINTPFAGALVPIKYYQQDARVKSVMIEINRGLYLAKGCEKRAGFKDIKNIIRGLIEFMGKDL